MKIQFSIRDLLIVVAFLALAAGWLVDHQRINHIAVQKWEYKTTVENMESSDSDLNRLAVQGWEVCGAAGHEQAITTYVLRRPVH